MLDKIIIGLTGPIGAGKTAVARLLWDKGYIVIVADAVGHEILARSDIKAEIREAFGDDVFDESGEIIRAPL
ncbi:MAG: dephospho-CoA kinase, partial [bacterium]|nr:dephospho-CoA kinase [bacterium]